jgi:thiamine-phosphate pyrophosphorylase
MRPAETLRERLSVYLVIGSQDCHFSPERTLQVVEDALAAGVRMVQFRDKHSRLTAFEREQLAIAIQTCCNRHDALFIVNDDVEMAVRLQADGVHVGQEDSPLAEVRERIPAGMIVGVSAGTVEEAMAALEGGADYIGVGAMFATSSKADAGEPIGPQGLQEIRHAVGPRFPIVGIGGITLKNFSEVISAGADGVAVISAITRAESPGTAARHLVENVVGILQKSKTEEKLI